MSIPLLLASCIVAGIWILWRIFRSYIVSSPLDDLPGPARSSCILGNLTEFFSRDGWDFQDALSDAYGAVVKINGMLGDRILYVYDPKAMHSIFVKDQASYDQPSWFFASNQLIFGPGLLATVGDAHKRQRKLINCAFSNNHLRHLSPILYRTVHRLRQALEAQVRDAPQQLDILSWLNRTTLELVGQSGLGYSFDPLVTDTPNAFGSALKDLLPALSKLSVLRMLVEYFDKLGSAQFRRRLAEKIPNADFQQLKSVIDTMDSRSRDIFREKKDAMLKHGEAVMHQLGEGKDLLSILIRANLASSHEDKLPEDELIAQMSTLVFAATDTTATLVSRILQLLTQHRGVQDTLREEISEACNGQDLSYDELLELPLLDAIYKETLRLYPPVTTGFRETQRDTILPFSEPIRSSDGRMLDEIHVPKGTTIIVGIRGANTYKAIWGPDADQWKPERWLKPLPESVTEARIPGVYSNLMSFLSGSRSCIGFKLAEIETKILLSVLVESFRFSPTDKGIVWNMAFVVYPTVGKDSMKATLPLVVEKNLAQ